LSLPSSSSSSSSSSMAAACNSPPPDYRANVGICLVNDKNEVFVASRLNIPGTWQMPQCREGSMKEKTLRWLHVGN
jgi:hypothetical protein